MLSSQTIYQTIMPLVFLNSCKKKTKCCAYCGDEIYGTIRIHHHTDIINEETDITNNTDIYRQQTLSQHNRLQILILWAVLLFGLSKTIRHKLHIINSLKATENPLNTT